jgi:hypothetical protein
MYPIALYGGLPEVAYLAPRGNFLTPRLAEEEERPRRTGKERDASALVSVANGVKPEQS